MSTILDALPHARLPSGDLVPQMPGTIEIYRLLDAEAVRIGTEILSRSISVEDYSKRAAEYDAQGLYWLAGVNRELADALATDIRLAAMPSLYSWVRSGRSGSISSCHVNWYRTLLDAHIAMTRWGAVA